MSIIYKVITLFLISFTLMIFVSSKTNNLMQNTIETLLKDKYIYVSDELFTYLSNSNHSELQKKIKELKFEIVEEKEHYFKASLVLYEYNTDLSEIRIIMHEDNKYLLYMRYLDDDILVIDKSQNSSFEQKKFLDYMILADILILIILSFLILKMVYPIKKISKAISKFGEGAYHLRVSATSNDEIGEVVKKFNSMASNIQDLIESRERLLRDIGHELKTPISKSKIALEMIEESKYKRILNKALSQIDEMVNELLYIEKLNSNQNRLNIEPFSSETLITEALSKLFIDDESLVNISINSSFEIKGDLNYLSIALKNLIDNALKYGTTRPVYLVAEDRKISLKSTGEPLDKPLEFYCEAFTKGDNSRTQSGYGLGLSLVQRVAHRHNFIFSYHHENGFNVFVLEM
ncbi:ArsS family sensor histidine kinase [Sulfurimonas sp.]|uniref:ArsS family sensor histidine kinase n=1 Tax=Sulfurimonas sp. TaxID=2022749 RepID=UPI0025F8B2D2|nr:ArsS family sensor histidine kinase [Sulfurimonas sp.]MBW6488936.1 ArsS family sensor histidine kinase [Sulfurimonas sp.]